MGAPQPGSRQQVMNVDELFLRIEERLQSVVSHIDLKVQGSETAIVAALGMMTKDLGLLRELVDAHNERFKTLADEVLRAHARLDQHSSDMQHMRQDITSLQAADRQRASDWRTEKEQTLDAIRRHVSAVVTKEIIPARDSIKASVDMLGRLEHAGTVGSIDRLITLLDPEKIAMLKEATDEQVHARVATKKKQDSLADISTSMQIGEAKMKPWLTRLDIVKAIVTILLTAGAMIGFDTCRHTTGGSSTSPSSIDAGAGK